MGLTNFFFRGNKKSLMLSLDFRLLYYKISLFKTVSKTNYMDFLWKLIRHTSIFRLFYFIIELFYFPWSFF